MKAAVCMLCDTFFHTASLLYHAWLIYPLTPYERTLFKIQVKLPACIQRYNLLGM